MELVTQPFLLLCPSVQGTLPTLLVSGFLGHQMAVSFGFDYQEKLKTSPVASGRMNLRVFPFSEPPRRPGSGWLAH